MITRLPLLIVPVLFLAGCLDAGVRAESGGCPPGEVCNPTTPSGLHFGGTPWTDCFLFCDRGIKTTAIGGTQTITVYSSDTSSSTFDVPFHATVFGNGASVQSVTPPKVVVYGESDTWTELSIVDSQDRLYDKIDLRTRAVDEVSLWPSLVDTGGIETLDTGWALWAPGGGSVTASLYSASGTKLADESMALQLAGDSATTTKTAWDRLTFGELAVGSHTVNVSQNGVSYPFEVRAVDTVTDISSAALGTDPTREFSAGQSQLFCFQALNGSDVVVGVDIEFSVVGDVTVESTGWRNCITVTGESAGPATLDAVAAGVRVTYPLDIREPESTAARRRPQVLNTSEIVVVPGYRAQSVNPVNP